MGSAGLITVRGKTFHYLPLRRTDSERKENPRSAAVFGIHCRGSKRPPKANLTQGLKRTAGGRHGGANQRGPPSPPASVQAQSGTLPVSNPVETVDGGSKRERPGLVRARWGLKGKAGFNSRNPSSPSLVHQQRYFMKETDNSSVEEVTLNSPFDHPEAFVSPTLYTFFAFCASALS